MPNLLTPDVFIMDVLNKMSGTLSDEQLILLKDTLYINLHDVQLIKATYELATTIENNDATLMEYYAVSLKTANKSDKTIKQYTRAAWNLRKFVNKNFKDITHVDIKYYFATKKATWSDVYANNEYNYINQFFSFLHNEDFIVKNPMRKVDRIKVHEKLRKPYTVTDLENIRAAASDNLRDIALIEFFLSTALRVESVERLKWKNLNFNKRQVTAKVKGGDIKVFRYNEKTEFYLMKYFDARMEKEHRTKEEMMERPLFAVLKKDKITKDFEGISCEGMRKALKRMEKVAHVDNIFPHRFRKTFACNAIAHGMPMEEVKEHLGHRNIQTTFRYADITDIMLEKSYRQYCE